MCKTTLKWLQNLVRYTDSLNPSLVCDVYIRISKPVLCRFETYINAKKNIYVWNSVNVSIRYVSWLRKPHFRKRRQWYFFSKAKKTGIVCFHKENSLGKLAIKRWQRWSLSYSIDCIRYFRAGFFSSSLSIYPGVLVFIYVTMVTYDKPW